MRSVKIIIISCLLLLSLSIGALALGNDYTFSMQWWNVVLSNTLINGSDLSNSQFSYIDNSDIRYDGVREEFNLTTDTIKYQGISTIFSSGLNTSFPHSFSISVPLHINVERRSEMIINLYLITDSDNTVISSPSIITSNNSYVPQFSLTYLGNPTITPNPSTTSTDFSGNSLYLLQFTYNNQLSTNMTVDYLDFTVKIYNSGTSTAPDSVGVSLGVITDVTSSVVLPTTFVEIIENINNRLRDVYVRVDDMRNTLNELNSTAELMKDNSDTTVEQLESIQSLIDDLSDKLSSSGSVSQQIYQTLTVPTPEVSEAVTQLEQTVAQAKEELAVIKETLDTVIVPTLDDITSANQQGDLNIDDALSSEDLSFMTDILNQTTVMTMILMVISLATVGYVLFGKR